MAALLGSSTFSGTALVAKPQQQQTRIAAFIPVRAAQTLQGRVVSTTNAKTAVVAVDTLIVHPVYQKRVKSTKKYIAHDEQETANVGDIVTLAPSRPLSKRKRFTVESVVKSAQ